MHESPPTKTTQELVNRVLDHDRLALARLITQIENGTKTGREGLDLLFSRTGHAHIVGVTGAPGTGKSSLVNQLAKHLRAGESTSEPCQVAILAIDPTSPYTGGAILGDRVRMQDLAGDPGIFIRSMASRGALGGLSMSTAAVVQLMDAAGFDIILVETVGAGQAEVEIASLAHTTLVVETPGFGDDIQTIKAGILEIADVLVVNKADQPGADNVERAIKGMLAMAGGRERQDASGVAWTPVVLRTVATSGEGVPELAGSIKDHKRYLDLSGDWFLRDRHRLKTELDSIIHETLSTHWKAQVPVNAYEAGLSEVQARKISPLRAAMKLYELALK